MAIFKVRLLPKPPGFRKLVENIVGAEYLWRGRNPEEALTYDAQEGASGRMSLPPGVSLKRVFLDRDSRRKYLTERPPKQGFDCSWYVATRPKGHAQTIIVGSHGAITCDRDVPMMDVEAIRVSLRDGELWAQIKGTIFEVDGEGYYEVPEGWIPPALEDAKYRLPKPEPGAFILPEGTYQNVMAPTFQGVNDTGTKAHADGPTLTVRLDPTQTQLEHMYALAQDDGCFGLRRDSPGGVDLLCRKESAIKLGPIGMVAIPYQVPFLKVRSVRVALGSDGVHHAHISGYLADPQPARKPKQTKKAKALAEARAARHAKSKAKRDANVVKLRGESAARHDAKVHRVPGFSPKEGPEPWVGEKATPSARTLARTKRSKLPKGGWVQPSWYKTKDVVVDENDPRLPWED